MALHFSLAPKEAQFGMIGIGVRLVLHLPGRRRRAGDVRPGGP